ncbi:HAD-like protein [Vararia minispora EC-137]|uniref:HAD-like protein n=1 Tax=Vararia minispora EC-137 TaxID=1314806 RepID=A0ACB8QQM2_9AGAM|nr:HAD-like protein [Vararia minispora EC-137]
MPSITVEAILFDMDGTLIDSTDGVRAAWNAYGNRFGFDGVEAAHATHGRRLADTLAEWCKLSDPRDIQECFHCMESAEIVKFEDEVINVGPVLLPGVLELIDQIDSGRTTDGPFGWTIVTSATSLYTGKALERCGVPLPDVGYVTSDDVHRGKPHPDPYLAGAKKIGVDPANCVVIEDAPSGLKSGRAAGSKTIAVCTSHTREQITTSGAKPDFIVKNLSKISVRWLDGKIELTIDDTL